MSKSIIAIALAALFAAPVFAQTPGPGQDRSQSAKPATATEKAAAKSARKAEGAATAKTASMADADPAIKGKAKAATPEERKAAAMKRKSEGAAANKDPKVVN